MSEDRARRLANWLGGVALVPGDALSLVHLGMTSHATIRAWEEPSADRLGFARDVLDAAQGDCDEREERSMYELRHMRAGDAVRSTPIKLQPNAYAERSDAGADAGRLLEVMAEQTRASHAALLEMLRATQASHEQTLSTLRRENARLGAANEREANARMELREELADLREALLSRESDGATPAASVERIVDKMAEHGPKFLELAKPVFDAFQAIPELTKAVGELRRAALGDRRVVELRSGAAKEG